MPRELLDALENLTKEVPRQVAFCQLVVRTCRRHVVRTCRRHVVRTCSEESRNAIRTVQVSKQAQGEGQDEEPTTALGVTIPPSLLLRTDQVIEITLQRTAGPRLLTPGG
jgi:hypothetical protein